MTYPALDALAADPAAAAQLPANVVEAMLTRAHVAQSALLSRLLALRATDGQPTVTTPGAAAQATEPPAATRQAPDVAPDHKVQVSTPKANDQHVIDLVSVSEGADILACGQQSLRRWIRQGRVPAVRLGKSVRLRRPDVLRIAQAGLPPKSP